MSDMPSKKKRTGRPPSEVKRMSLSLRVTPTVKKLIENAAAESGRSISQEVEMMIERAVQYDRIFAAAISAQQQTGDPQ